MRKLYRWASVLLVLAASRAGSAQSEAVRQLYAQAQADSAAGREEAAVEDYRKLLAMDASLPPAYNNLGRLLYNLHRYTEAVTVLRQGLALAPEMAPAQVMLGAALYQTGKDEEAVGPLQTGVAAVPTDRFARMTLACVLIRLKRRVEAMEQLQAILSTTPKDQEAWYVLGKLHLEMSQEAFGQVAAIDPQSPLAHEMDGEIMEAMQNTPGAVDAYKQALAAAPGDASALDHLAHLYWSTGDWGHARESLSALVAKQGENCIAHWRLADTLDNMGEPTDAAMGEVARALELCPELPQAHAERARLLLRLGRARDALPDLATAEKAAPNEPSVQRLYAQAYRALGETAKADAANERFRELDAAEHAGKEHKAARVIEANR